MTFIFGLIFLIFTIGGLDVLKSYRHFSRKELKARSLKGDPLATKLFQVATYQNSLEMLMYFFIAVSFTVTFFIFNSQMPSWLSFIFLFLLILVSFVWMPNLKASYFGIKTAKVLSGPISFVLDYVHPFLNNLTLFLKANFRKNDHIYDLKDLKNRLVDISKDQRTSINVEQVKLLENMVDGLSLEVKEIATPWHKLKHLYVDDTVGPIVLNELHKQGQKIVPVLNDKKDKELLGLINIERFDVNKDSSVKSKLERPIFYINENATLIDAFLTFSETNYAAFVVIDDNQKNVGVLTLGNLMERITKGLAFEENAEEIKENEAIS